VEGFPHQMLAWKKSSYTKTKHDMLLGENKRLATYTQKTYLLSLALRKDEDEKQGIRESWAYDVIALFIF